MNIRHFIPAVTISFTLIACGSYRQTGSEAGSAGVGTPTVIGIRSERPSGESSRLPRARIYRTSEPSDSLVPITVNATGTEVTSFPAPTDLAAPPVRLADGWLLDRRGITPASVFTCYTYSEYKALPEVPAPGDLLKSVRPDILVTEIVELPVSSGSVTPAFADSIIRSGLPGCRTIFKL